MLIADDELVQQSRILTLKSFCNSQILPPDLLVRYRDSPRSEERPNG